MFRSILAWAGFAPDKGLSFAGGGHGHSHGHGGHAHGEDDHGHTHGVIDPSIATTAEGLWAIKWSFVILMITTAIQVVLVIYTGSVALLADTVHNFGDAATAIPLGIAFIFARKAATARFNFGLNRVEDLAGIIIVGLIAFSGFYAFYASADRLINPQPIEYLGVLMVAGVVGFIGNEIVAVFRIRVGRRINSAALIADGYHARVDGFGSLAVLLGALGVWAGFPLADPIVGLLISFMIMGIVWQTARAVFTRMLDGIEPEVIEEIRHTAEHVPGLIEVRAVRARWLGHKLRAEVDITVDGDLPVSAAESIAARYEAELKTHIPPLQAAQIKVLAA